MNAIARNTATYYARFVNPATELLQPVVNVIARIYVAMVFFRSGLTKLNDWDSTLMLFEYEYSVPLLNFKVAAWMATIGELVLPMLLFAGLASRFSAAGLLIVNIVAVISLEEIAPAAYNEHLIWGVILAHVIIWGGDKLSIDNFLKRKLKQQLISQ